MSIVSPYLLLIRSAHLRVLKRHFLTSVLRTKGIIQYGSEMVGVFYIQGVFKKQKRPNFYYKDFILQHFKHRPLQSSPLYW
jgi:hypothetical protein